MESCTVEINSNKTSNKGHEAKGKLYKTHNAHKLISINIKGNYMQVLFSLRIVDSLAMMDFVALCFAFNLNVFYEFHYSLHSLSSFLPKRAISIKPPSLSHIKL